VIVRNDKMPLGTRITRIETSSFKCKISTAKEGVFKPLSTVIWEGDENRDRANFRPCAKIIWSSIMRKSDIQQAHEILSKEIDRMGEEGISLGMSLDILFSLLKDKGTISETLNYASYEITETSHLQKEVTLELGGYQLDQDIQDLKEEMEDMSHVLGVGPFARIFSDEKVFKANKVKFLGEKWECMLGVTNNQIYKIALSAGRTRNILESDYSFDQATNIFEIVNRHFLELYGNPTESKSNEELNSNIWDFSSANLVVSRYYPFNVINIIATSGTPFGRK
jgi:hypothetical protein